MVPWKYIIRLDYEHDLTKLEMVKAKLPGLGIDDATMNWHLTHLHALRSLVKRFQPKTTCRKPGPITPNQADDVLRNALARIRILDRTKPGTPTDAALSLDNFIGLRVDVIDRDPEMPTLAKAWIQCLVSFVWPTAVQGICPNCSRPLPESRSGKRSRAKLCGGCRRKVSEERVKILSQEQWKEKLERQAKAKSEQSYAYWVERNAKTMPLTQITPR
jgi:hypothetical protein